MWLTYKKIPLRSLASIHYERNSKHNEMPATNSLKLSKSAPNGLRKSRIFSNSLWMDDIECALRTIRNTVDVKRHSNRIFQHTPNSMGLSANFCNNFFNKIYSFKWADFADANVHAIKTFAAFVMPRRHVEAKLNVFGWNVLRRRHTYFAPSNFEFKWRNWCVNSIFFIRLQFRCV